MRGYVLSRYHKRRTEAIILLGGKCTHCGTQENLNFDHIDRDTKAFKVSKMWSLKEEVFWEEVAKCQILCESCHKIKTKESKDYLHRGA